MFGGTGGGGMSPTDDVPMFRAIIKTADAGAIIGKGGENIKRLRAEYSVSMSIPDSKSPERVLMIKGEIDKICQIIIEILPLFEDYKNYEDLSFDAELRMLVLANFVGSIMGSGGGKIKALREETGAQIKVYEDCCPFSQERVFRINGTPEVLVEVVRRILDIVQESSTTRQMKEPPLYYDPNKTGHDFPENEMQPRMSSSSGGSRSGGGAGRHYSGSYGGSGDAGGYHRDSQPGRHGRNSGPSGGSGGGGLMSRGAAGGRSMPPQMEMMDNPGPMGGPGGFGSFPEYGAPPQMVGGGVPHNFQPYGGAPHSFRHGGPDFGMDAGSDAARTMKVSIKNEDAGAVIGPKGATINRVRERSGCNIKIDNGQGPDSMRGMRIITITGTDQQIQFAQYLMQQSVKGDNSNTREFGNGGGGGGGRGSNPRSGGGSSGRR